MAVAGWDGGPSLLHKTKGTLGPLWAYIEEKGALGAYIDYRYAASRRWGKRESCWSAVHGLHPCNAAWGWKES